MQGFDPKWQDFPDYIIGITKEIWEDRRLDRLHDYYAPKIVVRMPGSISVGNQGVIAATMATLSEFPDRTLFGEDVIWSGTPESGMLSSHRIQSTATHLGHGVYGKPTGKKLVYKIIADCHARNNMIDDEWLIRDQGAIIRQLGEDPENFVRQQIVAEGGIETAKRPFTPDQDVEGPYTGRGNDNEWGQKLADILTRIMSAELSIIPKAYDRAAILSYPGGVEGVSHGDADRFWTGLRASFPSATFKIDHQIGRDDPLMPPRAALRWSLHGKHDGWGSFGPPTGADVYIMGATHAEFGPWGLRREYSLFDEVAVWKQIILQKGI